MGITNRTKFRTPKELIEDVPSSVGKFGKIEGRVDQLVFDWVDKQSAFLSAQLGEIKTDSWGQLTTAASCESHLPAITMMSPARVEGFPFSYLIHKTNKIRFLLK